MRLILHAYAEGDYHIYETTDDGRALVRNIEGQRRLGEHISTEEVRLKNEECKNRKQLLCLLSFQSSFFNLQSLDDWMDGTEATNACF